MGLSDTAVRNAKPVSDKTIKLSDGEGLQLWVRPSGAKTWALAYRFGGLQKKLTIGRYPAVGLREARRQKDEAKAFLAQGIDPSTRNLLIKQEQEAIRANTFESVAAELVAKKKREGKADRTIVKINWLLDFAKAALATRPVREITAPEVLAVLRPIETEGKLETAQRLRAVIGEVMRYAVATGKAERDPTGDLRGALSSPKSTPRPAIIEPKPFGGLLRAVDGHDGMIEVIRAKNAHVTLGRKLNGFSILEIDKVGEAFQRHAHAPNSSKFLAMRAASSAASSFNPFKSIWMARKASSKSKSSSVSSGATPT